MSFYNALNKHLILPLSDVVLKRSIYSQFHFLEKSQWWSKSEIDEFQNKKLKKLVKHAYENVSYYRKLFKKNKLHPNDIKSKKDLYKIPILTKKDIHNNFPQQLKANNISTKHLELKQSSGSTGQQTKYYITHDAYGFNIACNMRGLHWMGYRWGDRLIKVTQNERHSLNKKIQDLVNRTYLYTNKYNEKEINTFIDIIKSNNIHFIRSYPDPLLFITNYINKSDIDITDLEIYGINTTGNSLFCEVRDKIEKTFDTKIFDSYSCEGGANIFECPSHECYHVSEEYGIIEIIDEDGNQADVGRCIVTDLNNMATPFIRYDSKDILEKYNRDCSCGRNLMAIKTIKGRDNDILITPDGDYLIAQSFTTYFKYISSIEQFQVYQKDYDQFIFRLVVNQEFENKIMKDIKIYWQNHIGSNVKISVKLVDKIDLLTSRKRRFLIRDKSILISY